ATVALGEVSRGGRTRGDHQACDHDMGLKEKYIPCGIVAEDRGQLHITFGSSSKTSDFVVDALEAWWAAFDETEGDSPARRPPAAADVHRRPPAARTGPYRTDGAITPHLPYLVGRQCFCVPL